MSDVLEQQLANEKERLGLSRSATQSEFETAWHARLVDIHEQGLNAPSRVGPLNVDARILRAPVVLYALVLMLAFPAVAQSRVDAAAKISSAAARIDQGASGGAVSAITTGAGSLVNGRCTLSTGATTIGDDSGCTWTGTTTTFNLGLGQGLTFNASSKLIYGGANVLSQRNLANAQTFRLYTTTDSDTAPTNSEYLELTSVSSVPTIRAGKTGSGTNRAINLDSVTSSALTVGGANRLQASSASNFTYVNFFPGSAGLTIGGSGGNEFASGYFTTSIQGSLTKNLTESSATGLVRIDVPSGAAIGGSVSYTVEANDATDFQLRSGNVQFAIVNKAGTETCTVAGFDGTTTPSELKDGSLLAASLGTLTYVWGVDTTPTNGCTLTLNAVSSLTQTVLRINYRVNVQRTATVTGL